MSCFQENKTTNHTKNNKVWFKGRTALTETVFENDLMANLLDKDFKTYVLKMLREHVKKDVKKMMDEQNRYINKGIQHFKKLKRISGSEKYNNWNEKIIRRIQRQVWAGKKKESVDLRTGK